MKKGKIKIRDKKGFHYEVEVRFQPQFGLAFAYYNNESPIANVEYGRVLPPLSDDDQEWERYEELFSEWKDQAIVDLTPKCKEYFDLRYKANAK